MAIRIFDVNPDANRKSNDYIGTVRSGMQANGRPMSLNTWRFTTGDPEVAKLVADTFGGEVEEWDTRSDEKLQVITDAKHLDIVLVKMNSEMVLWGRNGKIRSCDGITQAPDDTGNCEACACPSSLADKKKAAKNGTGCEPSTALYFRLVGHEDLGIFRFFSGAWSFAKDAVDIEEAFEENGGAGAIAVFGKETVSFTSQDGENVTFIKPTVTFTGDRFEEVGV